MVYKSKKRKGCISHQNRCHIHGVWLNGVVCQLCDNKVDNKKMYQAIKCDGKHQNNNPVNNTIKRNNKSFKFSRSNKSICVTSKVNTKNGMSVDSNLNKIESSIDGIDNQSNIIDTDDKHTSNVGIYAINNDQNADVDIELVDTDDDGNESISSIDGNDNGSDNISNNDEHTSTGGIHSLDYDQDVDKHTSNVGIYAINNDQNADVDVELVDTDDDGNESISSIDGNNNQSDNISNNDEHTSTGGIHSLDYDQNIDVDTEIVDTDNDISETTSPIVEFCINCHQQKQQISTNTGYLYIDEFDLFPFVFSSLPRQVHQHKFCLLSRAINDVNEYKLCLECCNYLGVSINNNAPVHDWKKWKWIWPSFFWSLLSDQSLIAMHGGPKLWSYIPYKWRPWWVVQICQMDERYVHCSVESPSSYVSEMTDSHAKLTVPAEELKLGDMMKALNSHLLPIVRCPWGCTDYAHKCGSFSLDIVISHYIGGTIKTHESYQTKRKKIMSARSDFFTLQENLLLNPKWPI